MDVIWNTKIYFFKISFNIFFLTHKMYFDFNYLNNLQYSMQCNLGSLQSLNFETGLIVKIRLNYHKLPRRLNHILIL